MSPCRLTKLGAALGIHNPPSAGLPDNRRNRAAIGRHHDGAHVRRFRLPQHMRDHRLPRNVGERHARKCHSL
jgi:hypothetical protein